MKSKFKYILMVILMPLLFSNQTYSQEEVVGSWIISSNYQVTNLGYKNYQLKFNKDGINGAPIVLNEDENGNSSYPWSFVFSLGAYQFDGTLDLYFTEDYYYSPNQEELPVIDGWSIFNADAQIIRMEELHKYSLFCYADQNENPDPVFAEVKIDASVSPPTFEILETILDYPNTIHELNTAFIISNSYDCESIMYTISTANNAPLEGYGGLEKYSIDEDGDVNFEGTLIADDNNDGILIEEDYYGYNLEMQNKNEVDNPIIAWITSPVSSNINSKIFIYDDNVTDNHYALDFSEGNGSLIETGRIAGIEFSPFPDELDFMYVSCEELGLIKINWHNGELIEQYTPGKEKNFSHSFIQRAPDGNLYVVSDDGYGFGKISKTAGHAFDPHAFVYPMNGNYQLSHINYKQSENDLEGIKYYTLPENDLAKLTAQVAKEDNLCDLVSGSAIISISGGVPEYTLFVEWFNEDTEEWDNVSDLFFFNEETLNFEAPNLMEGQYHFFIDDAQQCEEGYIAYDDYFEIEEGDIYDFYDNLLTINSTTAPNIYGLDDLVWDQNDNDPEEGFLLDNTIMFKHGFRLNGNTTLTINNLRLEFDEDYLAKVIIEPGSKLILNNCTLTNYHCWDPDAKWAGIEVWGNKNAPQIESNQGKLVMNGSTIEHSHEAVQLWEPGNYNSSGGMIYAENSTFKNNRRAISFLSYIYTHPVLGYDYNYYSLLDHCNFINNEDYIDDNEFFSFISMWAVKGVSIKACNFNAGNENGNGINTIDAGFTLSSHCNGAIGPDGCLPQYLERCEFYNLDKAIYARNTDPGIIYPINIQHSYFYNNNYGAYLSGLYNVLRVNTSEFVVGNNGETKEKALCGEFFGRGIHIEGSNGFEIENNKFYKNTAAELDDDVIGIYAENNPSFHDIIYNNDFNDLKIGNDAVGTNRQDQGDDNFGLEYQCNDNINNSIDFEVIGIQIGDLYHPGEIFTYMGDDEIYGSARNSYTLTSAADFEMHWNHMSIESIHYYLHSSENAEGSIYKPTEIETLDGPGPNNYFQIVVPENGFVNQCPDGSGIHTERTTLTPDEQLEEEINFATAYQDYEAIESIYNDLKDGGTTEGTSLSIEAAQPDDTWELRDNLLGMSPYLSREVLELAANRTDVLPNSVLLDILAANPDELKKEDFIQFLENKEEPLPDYMIEILRDLSSGTTYKTALLRQMNIQKRNQVDAANKVVKSLINEEEQDREAIKGWLTNMENLQSDMQIAAILIAEENFNEANSLLDLLSVHYNLENDELDRFNADKDLLTLKIQLKQEDRNIAQLNDAEIDELEVLASGKLGMARTSARNILEAFYGYDNFCDCVDRNINKRSASFNYKDKSESPLKIEATPNPATHYVEFTYELSEIDTEGMITITDINGKLIQTFSVKYERGKQAWDTRNIPSGSYVFTLKTKYFEQSDKLIIQ